MRVVLYSQGWVQTPDNPFRPSIQRTQITGKYYDALLFGDSELENWKAL